jgi:MFS transporter, DHA1 family, tetracycline resistance protein
LPFWIAAGLSLANAGYGFLILPESLPRALRVSFDWRGANPFGALALLRSHTELLGLAFVNFLGNLAHAVLPSIAVLYMLYRYGFDERVVGLTLAGVGVASIVVQGGVVGPVTKRLGERVALMIGLAFGVVGFLAFGLARTGPEFWIGIPLMALWGLEGPACMALMSRHVGATEQGRLQGANASVTGIANLFGPGVFSQVFAVAVSGGRDSALAGAPFMLASALIAAAAVLAWFATRNRA